MKDQERDVSSTYVNFYDEIKDHVHGSETSPIKNIEEAAVNNQFTNVIKEANPYANLASKYNT